jgi:hypothetical protein
MMMMMMMMMILVYNVHVNVYFNRKTKALWC